MPQIDPFLAARPNPDRVDLARFVAPPYDVVSEAERAQYASMGANIVELTLPEGDDRYGTAATRLAAWLSDRTLLMDEAPALYVLEQTSIVEGAPVTVRGLLAAVALDAPEDGGVKPHERVYENVVSDRLALLEATRCDLEPIIAIYDGKGGPARELLDEAGSSEPLADLEAEATGDRLRFWRIEGGAAIAAISSDLGSRTFVIADGHHRWTTARRAAAARGERGTMLMLLQDIGRRGPALLAIHRVLSETSLDAVLAAMAGHVSVTDLTGGNPDAWASELAASSRPAMVFFDPRRAVRVEPLPSLSELVAPGSSETRAALDVTLLHEAICDGLLGGIEAGYAHHPHEVAERVRSGGTGILMRPTPLQDVLAVAGAGELLPRKSTFFLPKPVSGLLLRPHEANRIL